jgi:hypothetical protein
MIKDSTCRFGKQSKERMTIFVAANMIGEKLPLLYIGKSERPRQICTVKHLDFNYYFNPTAWMNEMVFFDFIQKLNVQMIKQNRSIIMFIDNCKAHPINLTFSNVKIVFLPANTTSVLQPMDAGVIKCFKGYYRTRMASFLIKWVANNQFGDTLRQNAVQFYQAVEMAVAPWNDVSNKTVSNCFRHCGFFTAKCSLEAIDEEYDELKQIESQFKAIVKEEIEFETFVNIDNHLSVAMPLNEYPTNETPVDNDETNDINGDVISDEMDPGVIDIKTVNEYLDCIKLYALQRSDKKSSTELLQLVNKMQNIIFQEPKYYTQVSLEKYINVD